MVGVCWVRWSQWVELKDLHSLKNKMQQEFRIVCPVTVEEYQVAQLYMVNKISSDETKGNEGVEVLKNEPFENEELGKVRGDV